MRKREIRIANQRTAVSSKLRSMGKCRRSIIDVNKIK